MRELRAVSLRDPPSRREEARSIVLADWPRWVVWAEERPPRPEDFVREREVPVRPALPLEPLPLREDVAMNASEEGSTMRRMGVGWQQVRQPMLPGVLQQL